MLADLISFLYEYAPTDDSFKEKNKKNTASFIFKKKPPIYLLVFDEYASSQSLLTRFGFNNDLDLKLKSQGFHIFINSSSNYNFTTFSIASLLNMDYLNNFNQDKVSHKDYLWAESRIYRNKSIDILERNHYEIHNLSIFDFKNHPSKRSLYLLPNKTLLLRNRTFFRYIFNDLGWHLYRMNIPFVNLWEKRIYNTDKENNDLKILLTEKKTSSSNKQDFFYAHFFMPHPPYFYDKFNKLRPKKEVLEEVKTAADPIEGYINNIYHTNSVINDLVFQIKRKENNNAIIMILGDHGYRKASGNPGDYFSNFNAIFLPDHLKIDEYPKEITLVNQMRFIFNLLAEENQPFLKDKMFYLKDAPPR
jgi:hypothetical protein